MSQATKRLHTSNSGSWKVLLPQLTNPLHLGEPLPSSITPSVCAKFDLKDEDGPGSVADGTSGTGNGNGNSRSVALNGGHTHQGCTDAIGKMCFNPP